jgi:hypothetical protein
MTETVTTWLLYTALFIGFLVEFIAALAELAVICWGLAVEARNKTKEKL